MSPPPSASESRTTVLLVEDDPSVRRSLQLHLRARGFDVRAFGACHSALAGSGAPRATVLVTKQTLPDGDGLTLLAALRARGWAGPAILLTSAGQGAEAAAYSAGYARVLRKPVVESVLCDVIERLLREDIGA